MGLDFRYQNINHVDQILVQASENGVNVVYRKSRPLSYRRMFEKYGISSVAALPSLRLRDP